MAIELHGFVGRPIEVRNQRLTHMDSARGYYGGNLIYSLVPVRFRHHNVRDVREGTKNVYGMKEFKI